MYLTSPIVIITIVIVAIIILRLYKLADFCSWAKRNGIPDSALAETLHKAVYSYVLSQKQRTAIKS